VSSFSSVDIPKFLKGMAFAQEVARGPEKSTICRLIMGQSNNYKAVFFDVNKAREKPSNIDAIEEVELQKVDPNAAAQLEATESDSAPSQPPVPVTVPVTGGGMFSWKTPTTTPTTTSTTTTPTTTPTSSSRFTMKIGGEVAEDRKMTMQAFNTLLQQMTPLQGELCPMKGDIVNPFTNGIMPDLSCPGNKLGGKRVRKTRKNKKSRKNKNKKSKRRQTRKY
jgi:hypothetical protein